MALLTHVTTRPVNAVPLASLGVAVSCHICPGAMLPVAGVTVTDATGMFVTVSAAVPVTPSLTAAIVVAPGA